MEICQKCQSTYDGDKAFCRRCGTALISQQALAAEHRSRGDALAAQGRSRAALQEYDAALRWQPDDSEVRERHAVLLRAARKRVLVIAGTIVTTVVVVWVAWTLLVVRVDIQIDPALTDYGQGLQILVDGKPIETWKPQHVFIGMHTAQA
ncbi:MAG: hypothetical protein ACRD3J_08740, partial [Thermoanaerobaculia bacterium]